MNKVEEIFTSWRIAIDPNQEQKELASERIKICDECEFKKTFPIIHCGECGCALKGKIFSPVKGACPKNKWSKVDEKYLSQERFGNLNLNSYIKIMKNIIKFLLGGFAVWLLIQSLDLAHYLLNQSDNYLFNLGLVVLGANGIILLTILIYFLSKFEDKNKK